MKSAKAHNTDDASQKLNSGQYKEVLIDFDITADDFFMLSDHWCDRGAKIKKVGKNFLIKIGNLNIPPSD